jgi:Flp pilus assembly protein TadG
MSNVNGKSGKKPIWKRFLKDQDGSVIQILGLAALPLFLATGAAIDMMRASREQSAFYGAVDAAALAIAGDDRSATVGLDAATLAQNKVGLQELAKKYILADYKGDTGTPPTINTEVTVSGDAVVLKSSLTFPTTIMSLAGVHTMTINASSTIKKAMRPIELTMVMDTTGSMASGGKIAGAKSAAHTLLETIYGGNLASAPRSEFLRVSLVPFAAGVRLDTAGTDFNLNWIDTAGANPLSRQNFDAASPAVWNNFYAWSRLKQNSSTNLAWNGCVETRMMGTAGANTDYNINDVAPNPANSATLFPAYFAPDVPGTGNSSTDTKSKYYGSNYITKTGTPNEYDGLATTYTTDPGAFDTDEKLLKKQRNYNKYEGAVIGTEASPTLNGTGPWENCAASKVVSMTYDRASIETGIDAMQADGNTLIPEGLAWGWRSISPGAPFTKVQGSGALPSSTIAPYGDPRWQKVMILMTDGDNNVNAGSNGYNNGAYSSYGYVGETDGLNRFGTTDENAIEGILDAAMLSVCQKVKDKGIELYVTSFGSGLSNATKNRLKACATDPSHYAHSTSPGDLVSFFDHVGENVLNKMIYVSK